MKRSLPLGASLMAAVAFVPRAVSNAWGVLLLFALVLASPALLPALGVSGGAAPWARAAIGLLALVVGLAAEGALYRLGVTGDPARARALGLGPAGLQFGRPELRLAAAAALIGLFFGVFLVAAGVLLVFVGAVLGVDPADTAALDGLLAGRMIPGAWKLLVLGAVGLGIVWTAVQLSVRLALYRAATVARERVVAVNALALSEGAFWPLLAGLVVVSAPALALTLWRDEAPAGAGAFPVGFEAPAHGAPLFWVVQAAVVAFLQTPLAVGFLSEAYKRLEFWPEHQGG